MTKQHSEDFKIAAVNHYKTSNSIRETSKIFHCSKSSLQRWIKIFEKKKKSHEKTTSNANQK
jgi:transposase-like protein